MNNKQLLSYSVELDSFEGSVILHLLKSRIEDFYKNYGIKINTLTEKIHKLQKEHFEMLTEDGKTHMVKRDENKVAILLPGKTLAEYQLAYDTLMEQPVSRTFHYF